ncbi:ABC transporter permease [Rarobacter faecitabidus]|uniref:NitT/TauT family transport system permease protein n=1 Tax=Rarobacter faecitabidus TaxID=13243 RepID=A0A542ZDN9_RARFA|nr:ABC transporter permease [Rarobacter faecitabidus]TQL58465.1 NitT/TauT family transport system permease protein [Rarobacter faecitabidus]
MTSVRAWDKTRVIVAPVVFGLACLGIWQWLVVAFDLEPYVLPSPGAIGEQFTDNVGLIAKAASATALNSLYGLILGVIVALLWAGTAASFRLVREASAPIVMAASVVPIVALAPVLYAMFGQSVQTARVLIAALAAFVPVYVNTLRGLLTVAPIHRDLMRVYAASPWQITRTVTLPGALPFFFTGLGIASSVSVISALVAEYFGGPVDGLGRAITSAVSSSRYALAWAYVVGAVAIGVIFFVATSGLERVSLRRR